MRISDWSSDVCSSDLPAERFLKIDESCFQIGTAFQTFEFAKSRYVRTNFFTQFVLEWQASFTGIGLGDLENVINGRIIRFVNRDDFPSIAIDLMFEEIHDDGVWFCSAGREPQSINATGFICPTATL